MSTGSRIPGRNNAPSTGALSVVVTQDATSVRATDPSKSLPDRGVDALCAKPRGYHVGSSRSAVPYRYAVRRGPHRQMRFGEMRGERPGTDDQQFFCLPARADGRVEGGSGGCLAYRHDPIRRQKRRAVEQGDQPPEWRVAVVQEPSFVEGRRPSSSLSALWAPSQAGRRVAPRRQWDRTAPWI